MTDAVGWNPSDYDALESMARAEGIPAGWPAAIMLSESGMNPDATNSIGCVGLIQFCLDKPPYGLTPAQQMPYVQRYFQQRRPAGGWISRAQLYQSAYLPATIAELGSDPSTIIARQGGPFYAGNEVFDPEGKGYITVGDLDARLDRVTAGHPEAWANISAGIRSAGGSLGGFPAWGSTALLIAGGLALGGLSFYLYENRRYLPPLPRLRLG